MRAFIAAVLLCFSSVGQAQTDAYSGIAADAVSSFAASQVPGLIEGNGLGWYTIPIRIGIVEHAKTQPAEDGVPMIRGINATSGGAAANNIALVVGIKAGITALVQMAPVIGIVTGVVLWSRSSDEREFYTLCARQKRVFAEDAALTCKYTPQT